MFDVVTCQISIAHTSTYTLTDSGASYSCVAAPFIKRLDMVPELHNGVCNFSLPSSENLTSWFCFKVLPAKIVGCEIAIDLLVLEMVNYDVILGMD